MSPTQTRTHTHTDAPAHSQRTHATCAINVWADCWPMGKRRIVCLHTDRMPAMIRRRIWPHLYIYRSIRDWTWINFMRDKMKTNVCEMWIHSLIQPRLMAKQVKSLAISHAHTNRHTRARAFVYGPSGHASGLNVYTKLSRNLKHLGA